MILLPTNSMSQAKIVILLSGILKKTCSVTKKDNIEIESKKANLMLNLEQYISNLLRLMFKIFSKVC